MTKIYLVIRNQHIKETGELIERVIYSAYATKEQAERARVGIYLDEINLLLDEMAFGSSFEWVIEETNLFQ